MPVQAVIYDFDGPILNSFLEGMRRVRMVVEAHGMRWTKALERRITRHWGKPGVALLVEALGVSECVARQLREEWIAMDVGTFMSLVPHAKPVLDLIAADDTFQTILTSRQAKDLMPNLEYHGLLNHFSLIQTADDGEWHKPNARVFHWTLERLGEKHGIGIDSCVFVGDTVSDAEAGVGAGIRTLMVRTGPYEFQRRDASGSVRRYFKKRPQNVLDSIADLPVWLGAHG